MSGNKLFLDTNILLYLLQGDVTLTEVLDGKQFYVSFITELELLSYSGLKSSDLKVVHELLGECVVIDINAEIKQLAVKFRKQYKVKLPDTIIAATSLYLNIPLITADSDFKKLKELELVFYER
ncbi:MAG: type II toxin-antitoxin system VapC family toxin [Bacteroidota bacterium]